MALTEDQLFAKGAEAIKLRIAQMQLEARRQIKEMRDHYETGHGGKHPVPEQNRPLDMFYKVMGDQTMDLQFLRQMAPDRFDRFELLYWILSGLVFATVREDIKWSQFEKDMLDGIDAFVQRQYEDMERPQTRAAIIGAGEMIAKVEAVTGKPAFPKQS